MTKSRRMGPFMLGEKLGAGGMGVVYRATYVKTGQQLAVKCVAAEHADNSQVTARFVRELKILKKLRNPHIVRCYGGGTQGDQMFYAMELVEGGSLASILNQRGRLSWEATVEYGLQICDALKCAHDHGIIHRDLKPGNLLLTTDGKLKLADFGIARDNTATALTAQGRALGTYAYMAPEVIRGDPPISHKSDLYSFGCVLFRMLTGRTPFEAKSPAQMFFQHIETTPPRVSTIALDCPVWLESLVAQLLEKDPQDRPFDASVVRRALAEVGERVASQTSITGFSMSGAPSTLSVNRDMTAVRKVLASKKKKKTVEKETPLYERAWFLAVCLALLVAGIAWAMWPLSEGEVFRRAEVLMASTDPADWNNARRDFLDPYQERFPDGPHAEQVQEFIDQIEMQQAESRLERNAARGREPTSEGERLYASARRYEKFGDRVTALERYESMLHLLADNEENRAFRNLARRQINQIENSGGEKDDRRELVDAALRDAEKLYTSGDTLGARQKWQSIVTLYADHRELAPLVERAQAKLTDPEAKPTDEDSGEATSEADENAVEGGADD